MDVLFLGKDNRYNVLIEYLSNIYNVECIGYEKYKQGNLDNISKYDIIVLPMYGIKEGKIDNISITKELINKIKPSCTIYTGIIPLELGNRKVISFMDDEEIKSKNNEITVDGIIDYIKDYNKSLICILGYGNIGKLLYERLKDKYLVCVFEKEKKSNNNMFFATKDFYSLKNILINSTLIINTVPKNIITSDMVPYIKGHILDIASYPYGINQELLKNISIDYYLYSSIPSKYDPERAGKILLKKF